MQQGQAQGLLCRGQCREAQASKCKTPEVSPTQTNLERLDSVLIVAVGPFPKAFTEDMSRSWVPRGLRQTQISVQDTH